MRPRQARPDPLFLGISKAINFLTPDCFEFLCFRFINLERSIKSRLFGRLAASELLPFCPPLLGRPDRSEGPSESRRSPRSRVESPATLAAIGQDEESIGSYAMRLASDNETQSSRWNGFVCFEDFWIFWFYAISCLQWGCWLGLVFFKPEVTLWNLIRCCNTWGVALTRRQKPGSSNICWSVFNLWLLHGMPWIQKIQVRSLGRASLWWSASSWAIVATRRPEDSSRPCLRRILIALPGEIWESPPRSGWPFPLRRSGGNYKTTWKHRRKELVIVQERL